MNVPAPRTRHLSAIPPAFPALLALAVTVVAATALAGPLVAAAALAGAGLLFLLACRYRPWFPVLACLLVFVVEEFPTNLVAEKRWDRSLTLLYGKSLLLPGCYGIDLLLLFFLLLYLGEALGRRDGLPLWREHHGLFLAATILPFLVSVSLSLFLFPETETIGAYRTSEIGIDMKASVAPLVPYAQMKTWGYIYLAYVCGRAWLRQAGDFRRLGLAVTMAVLANIGIGAYRLLLYHQRLSISRPLIYDDATHFLLVLFVVFCLLAWGRDLFPRRWKVFQGALVLGTLALILLSFRRAIWGGLAGAVLCTFFLVPWRLRLKILLCCLVLAAGGILAMSIGGWTPHLETAAVAATGAAGLRTSSFYRLAMLYNLLHLTNVTLFGFGAKPLWNEPLVMGSFHLNFENIHNLYYWLLLRTGVVGMAVYLVFQASLCRLGLRLRRNAPLAWQRTLAETLLIGQGLYLFMGWFHPVYAMARFTVLAGLLTAALVALAATAGEER